jgi:hypothetical protein
MLLDEIIKTMFSYLSVELMNLAWRFGAIIATHYLKRWKAWTKEISSKIVK